MPRPKKDRRVCRLPENDFFGPKGVPMKNIDTITITVDEYEVMRLIDLEGLKQEECAERMKVARSTVQRSYEIVKRKVADAIVNGKALRIDGGDYVVCSREKRCCEDDCN